MKFFQLDSGVILNLDYLIFIDKMGFGTTPYRFVHSFNDPCDHYTLATEEDMQAFLKLCQDDIIR